MFRGPRKACFVKFLKHILFCFEKPYYSEVHLIDATMTTIIELLIKNWMRHRFGRQELPQVYFLVQNVLLEFKCILLRVVKGWMRRSGVVFAT